MKLEVDKYYLDGFGSLNGPMDKHQNSTYKFICRRYGYSYATNGKFDVNDTTRCDLVTECTADGTPIAPKPAKKVKRKWYAVIECQTRDRARNVAQLYCQSRVVADLDLKGKK